MRRFSLVLLCGLWLLWSLSVLAQTPTPTPKPASIELEELGAVLTPITTPPSLPAGVIIPRPLLPLPTPQPTATPPQAIAVAVDSALSLPAS